MRTIYMALAFSALSAQAFSATGNGNVVLPGEDGRKAALAFLTQVTCDQHRDPFDVYLEYKAVLVFIVSVRVTVVRPYDLDPVRPGICPIRSRTIVMHTYHITRFPFCYHLLHHLLI